MEKSLTLTEVNYLYFDAKDADEAFQAALVKKYGKQAGDIRYQSAKQTPAIRALGDLYREKIALWRTEYQKL